MNFYDHQHHVSLYRCFPFPGCLHRICVSSVGGTLQLNLTVFCAIAPSAKLVVAPKKILHQLLKIGEHWISELYQFTSDFQRTTWWISANVSWVNKWKAADLLLFTFSSPKWEVKASHPCVPSSTPPSIYPSSIFPSTHPGRGDAVSEVEKQWK